MTSMSLVLLVFGLVSASLRSAYALTDEEKGKIKSVAEGIMGECGKEYGVPLEEIKAAKQSGNIDELDPCLLGCPLHKMKLINDEGLFDVETAEQVTKTFFPEGDELKKVFEIIESCKSVNDEDVSDGTKGCERAKLLLKCLYPHKKDLAIFQ